MELVALAGSREETQPKIDSLRIYYQSVCEQQRRASLRNTTLLHDVAVLRQKVQLFKKTASEHISRFTSLKWRYEGFVSSEHSQWMNINAQQPAATTHSRHGNRQPDPLITLNTDTTGTRPTRSHDSTVPPPQATVQTLTLLKPHPLPYCYDVTSSQPLSMNQNLLSQHKNSLPSAPLRGPVSSRMERETVADNGDQKHRMQLNDRLATPAGQTLPVKQTSSKDDNAISSRDETSGRDETAPVSHSGRKVEVVQPKRETNHCEGLKEELSLSSLSPSPSPSLSPVSLPSPASCPAPEVSKVEDASSSLSDRSSVLEAASPPPAAKEEDPASLSANKDNLIGPAAEEEDPVSLSTDEDNLTGPAAKEEDPASLSANKDDLTGPAAKEEDPTSLSANEEDNIGPAAKEEDPASLSANKDDLTGPAAKEEDPTSLSANEEDNIGLAAKEEDPVSLSANEDDLIGPAAKEEDSASLSANEDDLTGPAGEEEDPASLSANEDDSSHQSDEEEGAAVLAANKEVTTITNLISTLNGHLDGDAESADLMYTLPSASDGMKGEINNSQVLISYLTKTAACGKDVSTWDPGAVSMVLLQQLSQLTSLVGGLLPWQLLDKDAPVLTSCDELSSHLSSAWSIVWPSLLEHIQLLFLYGRSITDLAATFTPPLVATSNPSHREKACLHLLSILQEEVKSSHAPAGEVMRRESLSLSDSFAGQLSLEEEMEVAKEQTQKVELEMATTVFGGDNGDLSQHSSLISEGSAIAEIERELQDVVSRGSHGDRERTKKEQLRSLNNFTTPTLNFDPSDASTCTESDELSDVAAPQSSTGYIPTALEQQRSSVVMSQASNQSSLKRRLGLLGDSDSDLSDLDDSLLPPTTPLNNYSMIGKRAVVGDLVVGGHRAAGMEEIEQDDFDFYG